jgi:hypothetical protein
MLSHLAAEAEPTALPRRRRLVRNPLLGFDPGRRILRKLAARAFRSVP